MSRNIVDAVLDEYVVWGGPIVQRRVALADCRDLGFDDDAVTILVFGRSSVPAPADPAAHVAMLAQIRSTFR